jgi:hypothetical protein
MYLYCPSFTLISTTEDFYCSWHAGSVDATDISTKLSITFREGIPIKLEEEGGGDTYWFARAIQGS